MTFGLLEEVSDIPRRVKKNPQPLEKGCDPLSKFFKMKNTVHCAQISHKSLGCETHIAKSRDQVGPKFDREVKGCVISFHIKF